MEKKNYKQVIVIRKDLKMRRGKEIAQGAHASGKWMVSKLLNASRKESFLKRLMNLFTGKPAIELTDAQREWMSSGMFTKITLVVNSEKELRDINDMAKKAGLDCHMITDAGLTEFNGVHTLTCLAIGPDVSEEINKITGQLTTY